MFNTCGKLTIFSVSFSRHHHSSDFVCKTEDTGEADTNVVGFTLVTIYLYLYQPNKLSLDYLRTDALPGPHSCSRSIQCMLHFTVWLLIDIRYR